MKNEIVISDLVIGEIVHGLKQDTVFGNKIEKGTFV